jgi:hypothetical protein
MSRRARIADPAFAKTVADLYLSGMTRAEMADELDCAVDTISLWTGDPRVQVHISAGSKARVNRITRKIDQEIEGRLIGSGIKDVDLETLLRIRKELKGKAPEEADRTDAASGDIWDVLDNNPELVEQITKAATKD